MGREKNMTKIAIQTATETETSSIIAILVLAFSTDPVLRWMYPYPSDYLRHFPDFAKVFASKAFAQRTAYYGPDWAGTALWLPPGIEPDLEEVIIFLKRTVTESLQEELFDLFEQMGRYHPNKPHWYLPLIGVETRQQHRGLGSALVEPVLSQCDRDQRLAYLESTNPDNISFYERHGFEVLDTIQVGSSPPVFPMLRQPQ